VVGDCSSSTMFPVKLGVAGAPAYLVGLLRWGLENFLPWLALNCSLLCICLSSSWDYRCEPLCPAYLANSDCEVRAGGRSCVPNKTQVLGVAGHTGSNKVTGTRDNFPASLSSYQRLLTRLLAASGLTEDRVGEPSDIMAVLFTIANLWNQPGCPRTNE
jgi:hypothetical protein